MTTLKASGINMGYPGKASAKSVLLKDFNLSLAPGDVLAVIGANGAGKSTLLRILAGLQKPISGSVSWNDRSLDSIPFAERPKIAAALFREFARVEGFTVRDLVGMGRQPFTGIFGRLNPEDYLAIDDAMAKTGTTILADQQTGTLSDGEFQKVMLAKMLAQNASLLILDEPTTHLDLPSALEFLHLIRRLAADEKKAIIFSSHNLPLVFKLSDRVLLLGGQGQYAIGTPDEISNDALMCGFLRTNEVRFAQGNLIFDVK